MHLAKISIRRPKAAHGVRSGDFKVIASSSLVPAKARQPGPGAKFASYPVRGLDPAFLHSTGYA